jgi:hypothetical protein
MRHSDPRVGIRSYRHGWRAYVRVDGTLVSRTFPRSATRDEMQAWRRSQRPELATSLAPTIRVHELSDQLKTEILKIVQEAIRDQANGKGPTLQGVRVRLYPPSQPTTDAPIAQPAPA